MERFLSSADCFNRKGTQRTQRISGDCRLLGRFETDTGVTREASGKIIGYGQNQLLKLLK
jgi:hypothetical protein